MAAAAAHFEAVLKVKPGDVQAIFRLGQAMEAQGRQTAAVERYMYVLKAAPDTPAVLDQLARLHATSEQPEVRNPEKAIQLAQRACGLTQNRDPGLLETLSLAYAAAGRIEQATIAARQALLAAQATGRKKLAQRLEDQIGRYEGR
jgi:tetratricopeptide (TPR) repeat protein